MRCSVLTQRLVRTDIHVWLPPSYDKVPEKRYPVLYCHDGQNLWSNGNVPANAFSSAVRYLVPKKGWPNQRNHGLAGRGSSAKT
eukprot:3594454-Rhodomonas_salina.4